MAFLAIAYVNTRAGLLAFTYDECWSFNAYAKSGFFSIFWNLDPSANNHILHSMAMRVSYLLFGQHEYSLRLPSLLAHFLYVIFSIKLLKDHFPKVLLVGFILLNFQPFLLDFFVAARGYGMAMAFTISALYFLLNYSKSFKRSNLSLASILISLAAWSNFTYLLLTVSLLFIGFILILMYKNEKRWRHLMTLFIPAFALCIWMKVSIGQLIEQGELYYGGQSGFFIDTVQSLAFDMIYRNSTNILFASIWPVLVLISLIISLYIILKYRNKYRIVEYKVLVISFLFLIGPIVGSVIMHFALSKPYLIGRTAIFLIPLSLILFLSVFQYVFKSDQKKLWSNTVLAAVATLSLIIFAWSVNFSHLLDFKEHADTSEALLDLKDARNTDEIGYLTLGKSKYMNATINFYHSKYSLGFMSRGDLTFCNDNGPYPYYYLFQTDLPCLNDLNVELIKHYPVSNTYLYRNLDLVNLK